MHYGVCICCLGLFAVLYLYVLITMYRSASLHLDIDRYACGHLQSLKSINCLLSGSNDVDQSLVSSLLELLTAVLILVDSAKDGNNLLLCRKRNGTANLGTSLLDCLII